MGQVSIHYCTEEGGEKKVIPVDYLVEHRADLSLKVMHCTVALSDAEKPTWLYPMKFNLIAYPGHVVTPCNPDEETFLSVPDADLFRYKVYGKILSAEQGKGEAKTP